MKNRFNQLKRIFLFLFTFMFSIIHAQDVQISGKVLDQNGNPVPGVNIVEKGTVNGTISDINGNFTISTADAYGTLTISYVGYLKQELPLEGKTNVTITLVEDFQDLGEVVVIGYGTVKKSDITGAVSVVKTEEIADQSASKIGDMLQGRVAGLQINKTSDDPNSGSSVRIRGASSLTGSNSPLVVIDGFPFSNDLGGLKQINPENIASIEVLKDASASAIYGSQGANGVILITTKTGKEGVSQIYVKNQTTFGTFASEFDVWRDPALMATISNERNRNGNGKELYVGDYELGIYYPSIEELESGMWPLEKDGPAIYSYTDWTKEVFRDYNITENITIGANGGDENTKYNLSFNYWDEQGNVKQHDYERFNVFATVEQKVKENISLKFNTHINITDTKNATGTSYGRNPIFPVYIENNPLLGYYRTGEADNDNPVMRRDLILSKSRTLDLISSGLFSWEIIPGLTLNSTFSYKYGTSVSDNYTPDVLTESYEGVGSIGNYLDYNLSSENFLTYRKQFGEHNFSIMGGWTFERYTQRTSGMTGRDFFSDALQNEALDLSATDNRLIYNGLVSTGLESVYGRLNYSLKDKYLLTFTARADGSTKFGDNYKWGFFPSGAVSWKAHQEDFIADLGIFNELKPRISYGFTGNQGVSPYQTKARYGERLIWDGAEWRSVIGPGYIGSGGRFTTWWGIPSRDLRWESTSQLNFGLDLGFIDNRLKVNVDYYFKHTTDLLRRKILPPSSSYDFMMVNDGIINNRGIEIMVDYVAVNTGDFMFAPTITFSKNRNSVIDIGTAADAGLIEDNFGNEYIIANNNMEWVFGSNIVSVYALGQPMLSFYGFRTDGIIQTVEEGLEAGLSGAAAQPGEIKYVDLNGDGVVDLDGDTEDREIIGNPEPDFIGSLNLNFKYKKFDFSAFLYGVYGNDVLDTQKFGRTSEQAQRWTPDVPSDEFPSLRNNRGWPVVSDFYIVDGSYLRLQNVSLGYTTSIKKLNIASLRVYVNIYNLATITKFAGYDPEVGVDGIYWGGKPRQRTATIGVNFTF